MQLSRCVRVKGISTLTQSICHTYGSEDDRIGSRFAGHMARKDAGLFRGEGVVFVSTPTVVLE